MSLVPGSGCSSLPSAFAMNSPISFGTGNTREKKICCGGACAATATHARRTKPTATRILMSSSPSPTLRDVSGGQKNTTVELAMHVRGLTHRLQLASRTATCQSLPQMKLRMLGYLAVDGGR